MFWLSSDEFYMKSQLAYTRDDVLVKNLYFSSKTALLQSKLQSYFKLFGLVERLNLYPSVNGRNAGFVVFENPCDAAKVLRARDQIFNLNIRPTYSKHQWEYYMKGELAYTEDHVLVKNLFLKNIAEELEPQQLQNYFEKKYGCVKSLRLFQSEKETRSIGDASGNGNIHLENRTRAGYISFSNPCDAAKALLDMFHSISECIITVRPSYSWHQPDADKIPHRPENVDPKEPAAAIMKLNDHCLEHIFSQLSLPDRIHFARTCFRFCNIYKGMSPSLDKSINFQLFEALTAWELRDFFKLSGRNIKNIEGTIPRRHCQQVCSFLGMHCINLQSMSIRNNNFTELKINIFQVFSRMSNLQKLELDGCNVTIEDWETCKHLRLNLSNNHMMTGRYMNYLPKSIKSLTLSDCSLKPKLLIKLLCRLPLLKELNLRQEHFNCCKSLEVLYMIARLPSLKKLTFITGLAMQKMSPILITRLVENKSKQLEHFEISYINDEIIREIGKLTALHTLILKDYTWITDSGLGALFSLQELREIIINGNSNITDNGVLRLILDCPKLQVLHLEHCGQLTDKLLYDIILKLKNNQCHRPLPIKLYMTGTKVRKFTLLNPDVAAKNVIDLL